MPISYGYESRSEVILNQLEKLEAAKAAGLVCTVLYCTVLYCTVLYCIVPGPGVTVAHHGARAGGGRGVVTARGGEGSAGGRVAAF